MRKITLLFILTLLFSWEGMSQILNEPAGWPNTDWTVTGTYNTDPDAFEADPTLTSNFAFDDDDAGNGSDDDIAAESPVIDLTAAVGGGESWIFVDVDYTYNDLDDTLTLEYYDADGDAWVIWEQFVASADQPTNNFCDGTRDSFTSIQLDVTTFTATQLSGFRYRIQFLDDGGAGGAAYEWGFCFDAPTLYSQTPPSCPLPETIALDAVLDTTADFSWSTPPAGTPTSYDWEVVPQGNAQGDGVVASGNATALNAMATGLAPATDYSFYLRTNCDGASSEYSAALDFTTLAGPPPANDLCAGAVSATQETDIADADSATAVAGTIEFAIESDDASDCFGGGNTSDDVWFSFTALTASVNLTVETAFDSSITLYSGDCSGLTEVACADNTGINSVEQISATGLTVNDVYYFRVYQYQPGPPADPTFTYKLWSPETLSNITFEDNNAFTYFPNPVKNELSIKAASVIQNISVYNMLGQEVLRSKPNTVSNELSMSSLKTGTYFVNVTINNVTETIKILKQ